MSRDRWFPLRTSGKDRVNVGELIAHKHAVWRVVRIEDVPLSDADRDVWLNDGMPDPETWSARPYRITLDWVAGAAPPWAKDGDDRKRGTISVPARAHPWWRVYTSERWPQCSCCGEPMPCRAELEDEQVSVSLDQVARFEAIPAGACWACAEPITIRQKAVTYPGENLDLPGGQQVHFHTRRACVRQAHEYEERWLAADPRRERILTWPRCDGVLVVHADGSSECRSGGMVLGKQRNSQPDCEGHLTHDHSSVQACYVSDNWLTPSEWEGGCPRGCSRIGHPGTCTTPRPARREPTVSGLFELESDHQEGR